MELQNTNYPEYRLGDVVYTTPIPMFAKYNREVHGYIKYRWIVYPEGDKRIPEESVPAVVVESAGWRVQVRWLDGNTGWAISTLA